MVAPCSSVAEFVAKFRGLADRSSLFVPASKLLPMGSRRRLLIELKNGDIVMRFQGEVIELQPAKTGTARKGMRFKLLQMDPATQEIHQQLLSAAPADSPSKPPDRAAPPPTPGSRPPAGAAPVAASEMLPANPFAELPPQALEHFVECTLYEETSGQFGLDALARDSGATQPAGSASGLDPALDSRAFSQPVPLIPATMFWTRVLSVVVIALVAGALGLLAGYLIWGRSRRAQPERVAVAAAAPREPAPAPAAPPSQPAPPTPPKPAAPAAQPAAADPPPPPTQPPPPAGKGASAGCVATIESSPRGANVTWEGRPLGETPLSEVSVPCGSATVVIKRQHYKRIERTVEAVPGAPALVSARLARPSARLELTSSPPGASFTVGGQPAGKAPTSVTVEEFTEVTVTASLPGHARWTQKLYVKDGHTKLHASLLPAGKRR